MSKDFFIAACGRDGKSGVYRFESENGCLKQKCFFQLQDASYLVLSRDRTKLFVALENSQLGGLASFNVLADGRLELISEMRTPGMGFCHLALTPNEKYVYAADYGHGTASVFCLDDGKIITCDTIIRHSGHGPNPLRQEGPHIHYAILTPDGKYLCLVDLGLDAIFSYPLDENYSLTGEPPKRSEISPAGSGPRHFIFNKDGKTAFLVNELANTVMVLDYQDGAFAIRQTVPMLPESVNVPSKASAIRMSPDGKFLLASNRGYDTIATYAIAKDSTLTPSHLDFIGGQFPRDFNFLPDGKEILVGCEISGNAFLFAYDEATGRMAPAGAVLTDIPRPICIIC